MLSPILPEHRKGNNQLTRAGQLHLVAQLRMGVEQMGWSPTEVAREIGITGAMARAYAKAHNIQRKRVSDQLSPSKVATLKQRDQAEEQSPADPEDIGEERHRRALHDADFQSKQNRALRKRIAGLEKVLDEVSGLAGVHTSPPEWRAVAGDTSTHRSVVGGLISDVHDGEVIDPDEILGVNAFNPDVCADRLERYFQAACQKGLHWADDTDLQGFVLFLAGDLISGDIHEELRNTNALTSHQQMRHVVECLHAGVEMLLDAYPHVHIVSVPGNHGRTTLKSTAKQYADLSYDILATQMLQDRMADDRITWQYGRSKDQIVPIFGRTVFVTHGDKMGTGGGQGFAGPMLPIVRGTKKISAQQASVGRKPDLILHGHYHTSGNPGNVFSNGSVPGHSEFGDDIRAPNEPPQQWLFLLHEKWWVRDRAEIKLEEPAPFERPRVRVPAGMAV
jgi:hypothetical protein